MNIRKELETAARESVRKAAEAVSLANEALDEANEAMKAIEALSDNELDQVAGGGRIETNPVIVKWTPNN